MMRSCFSCCLQSRVIWTGGRNRKGVKLSPCTFEGYLSRLGSAILLQPLVSEMGLFLGQPFGQRVRIVGRIGEGEEAYGPQHDGHERVDYEEPSVM